GAPHPCDRASARARTEPGRGQGARSTQSGSRHPAMATLKAPRPGRAYIAALRVYQVCSNLLADPLVVMRRVQEAPSFIANLVRYRRRAGYGAEFPVRARYLYPVLGERHAAAGQASGHYFHQDIWAARHIPRVEPARLVD